MKTEPGPAKRSDAELGRPTPAHLAVALLVSIGAGLALGAVYGSGNYWVGTFKTRTARGIGAMTLVNLLIFGGALFVLLRTTRVAVRFSRFRSLAFVRVVGACGGLACIYSAWAAFGSWSGSPSALRAGPAEVGSAIGAQIREIGTPFIPAVYATEAALLLFLPSRLARRFLTETPFCGACRQWLTLRKGILEMGSANVHKLLPAIRQGRLEVLSESLAPDRNDYVRLDYAACDGCGADGFLSLTRVIMQINSQGNLHEWETVLLRNAPVSRADFDRVIGQA